MIDEIEKELKKISRWPWLSGEPLMGIPFDYTQIDHSVQRVRDAEFVQHSPERIAALVEYVRAAEKVGFAWERSDPDPENKLQTARAKLGLK